jgi:hypothetical protein
MPASDEDGLTVSISQLKEFTICPRRYQLHRVLGVEPAFVPVPLALGSATHAAMGAMYTSIHERAEVPAVEAVLQVFRDTWALESEGPVPIKLDDDAPDPVDVGVRMLSAFHRHVLAAGPVSVVAVELPFSGVELHDPDTGEVLDEKLSGVIDLVVREHDHNVIVEHKTAARSGIGTSSTRTCSSPRTRSSAMRRPTCSVTCSGVARRTRATVSRGRWT